jgi:hypothetical protein
MLLCDRCKKPIVGESKKLLDVCPECYAQVMSYISTGNPSVGVARARMIGRLATRFTTRAVAAVLILLVLLSVSSYFAISTYSQYEAPLVSERGLVGALSENITQEQSTVQAAAALIVQYKGENANLASQIAYLNQTIANDNQTIASDNQNISSLEGVVASLRSQSSSLENTVSGLQDNITTLKDNQKTFVIWNAPVNVTTGYFLFETVPDTFDYHDNFTSSAPVDVFYFNSTQFVQWYTRQPISGDYENFTQTEGQSDTFTLAEGCGGYIVIYSFMSAGTIHPNVSATYNPAPKPTGSCAEIPG